MYYSTPSAILGFLTVMTGIIGTTHESSVEAVEYARLERAGKMQIWKLARLPRELRQPLLGPMFGRPRGGVKLRCVAFKPRGASSHR